MTVDRSFPRAESPNHDTQAQRRHATPSGSGFVYGFHAKLVTEAVPGMARR